MQVRISQPTKSSMQSADSSNQWLLEFVKKPFSKSRESLMGRTSSNDMSNEIKIIFPTLEKAIEFAKKKHYSYEIIQPKKAKISKKSYADNFIS